MLSKRDVLNVCSPDQNRSWIIYLKCLAFLHDKLGEKSMEPEPSILVHFPESERLTDIETLSQELPEELTQIRINLLQNLRTAMELFEREPFPESGLAIKNFLDDLMIQYRTLRMVQASFREERRETNQRVGVVAHRIAGNGEVEVLVVPEPTNPEKLTLPTSALQADETLEEAAQREIKDVCGYFGQINRELGVILSLLEASRTTLVLCKTREDFQGFPTGRAHEWVPLLELPNIVPDKYKPMARDVVNSLSE